MTYDCIVVGGGAAGLSAALVLGRARRRTLLIDAGEQSNRPAEGIGGLLGHDGRPPADLYAAARSELGVYGTVELRDGRAVAAERDGDFLIELDDGTRAAARTVILATGMEYRYPAIPGAEELWGRSVFHCPFCHGWEVRDGKLAVLDDGNELAPQRARLLRAWSDDVTLLEADRVTGVRAEGGSLAAVELDDGTELPLDALLVPVRLHQRSPLPRQLGAALASNPMSDELVEVDARFATSVPGLFAAGDVINRMQSVANAIAGGSSAAAGVVQHLTQFALV